MLKYSSLLLLAVLVFSCNNKPDSNENAPVSGTPFTTDGKKVISWTTADRSDLRLSLTDTLTFKERRSHLKMRSSFLWIRKKPSRPILEPARP